MMSVLTWSYALHIGRGVNKLMHRNSRLSLHKKCALSLHVYWSPPWQPYLGLEGLLKGGIFTAIWISKLQYSYMQPYLYRQWQTCTCMGRTCDGVCALWISLWYIFLLIVMCAYVLVWAVAWPLASWLGLLGCSWWKIWQGLGWTCHPKCYAYGFSIQRPNRLQEEGRLHW